MVLVLAVVASNAGAWTDTSVLVTNVRNFPNQRGKVVGAFCSVMKIVTCTMQPCVFKVQPGFPSRSSFHPDAGSPSEMDCHTLSKQGIEQQLKLLTITVHSLKECCRNPESYCGTLGEHLLDALHGLICAARGSIYSVPVRGTSRCGARCAALPQLRSLRAVF